MRFASLIYDRDYHYLDHLAPLSALLDIPCITTEEDIYQMISSHYPDVKPVYMDSLEIPIKLLEEFDGIIYSFTEKHFQQFFPFAQVASKKLKTYWCPHGNSDKDNLGALLDEPRLLIYGKKMEAALKEKQVTSPSFTVGNYRLLYYQKKKEFYDKLLPIQENPTYLYAPTWDDYENNSSFKDSFPMIW